MRQRKSRVKRLPCQHSRRRPQIAVPGIAPRSNENIAGCRRQVTHLVPSRNSLRRSAAECAPTVSARYPAMVKFMDGHLESDILLLRHPPGYGLSTNRRTPKKQFSNLVRSLSRSCNFCRLMGRQQHDASLGGRGNRLDAIQERQTGRMPALWEFTCTVCAG
jgi:hypothetical protein